MGSWYFAHPSTAQSRGDRLRRYLERMSGVVLVNPFTLEANIDPITQANRLVLNDLQAISKCQGLLAWFPRYPGGSQQVGTSMEVCFARHVVGIPVIIYAHDEIAQHPWLQVHGAVFTHIAPLIVELRKYGEQPPVPH